MSQLLFVLVGLLGLLLVLPILLIAMMVDALLGGGSLEAAA
jgi:hypothetical protein